MSNGLTWSSQTRRCARYRPSAVIAIPFIRSHYRRIDEPIDRQLPWNWKGLPRGLELTRVYGCPRREILGLPLGAQTHQERLQIGDWSCNRRSVGGWRHIAL